MGQAGQSKGTTLAPSNLQSFLVYHCEYLAYCQNHAHCAHSTSATHPVQVSGWGHADLISTLGLRLSSCSLWLCTPQAVPAESSRQLQRSLFLSCEEEDAQSRVQLAIVLQRQGGWEALTMDRVAMQPDTSSGPGRNMGVPSLAPLLHLGVGVTT